MFLLFLLTLLTSTVTSHRLLQTNSLSNTFAFDNNVVDVPTDEQFCGHQVPGDNHYGTCDRQGVIAKKLCQRMSYSDGCTESSCASRAANSQDCAGNVFWVRKTVSYPQHYGQSYEFNMHSCSCLVNGLTLDDVELTTRYGSRTYVFNSALPLIAEGELKYKAVEDGTFDEYYMENWACSRGGCDRNNMIYIICEGYSFRECARRDIESIEDCAEAVAESPQCGATFVASNAMVDDAGDGLHTGLCACVRTQWKDYERAVWSMFDVNENREYRTAKIYTFYPGTEQATFSPTVTPSFSPTTSPTTSQPTLMPISSEPTLSPITSEPTRSPTDFPTDGPTVTPTMNPTTSIPTTSEPSMLPTFSPSDNPTVQPSNNPTLAPTRSPRTREIHFLNKFEDLVGSEEEKLDEFLTSCTQELRRIRGGSTTSCVFAWSVIGQTMVRLQDYCGNECSALDDDSTYVAKWGLDLPEFGHLWTSHTGTPGPTRAPTAPQPTSAPTTPAPTSPCANHEVDIIIAVWLGATVDWSITKDSLTIVQEGQPEPPACHADNASYLGPDDGEDPILYKENCCLPGGDYILSCRGTFDWGDSSVSVNGQEYCRGLKENSESHHIHLDGPEYDPTGSTTETSTDEDIWGDLIGDLQEEEEENSAPERLFSVVSIMAIFFALL